MENQPLQPKQPSNTSLRQAFIALAVLIPIVGIGFFFSDNISRGWDRTFGTGDMESVEVAASKQVFGNPVIEAKAGVVYDLETKQILFAKNSEAQLPLASLTKLMTVLVISDLVKPTQIVTLDRHNFADETGDLVHGDKWSFKDLLWYTLVRSSNNAAAVAVGAAADAAGFQSTTTIRDLMNDKAHEIGLTQTYFLNQTGLDVNEQMAGAYGSATDMAKLIAVTAEKYPDILEVTRYESVMLKALPKDDRWAENTDKIVEEIPGIIASKTGFTDLAGGNLAVVFDLGINHRVAIAVLGSSREGRFTDVKALLNATLSYYRPE